MASTRMSSRAARAPTSLGRETRRHVEQRTELPVFSPPGFRSSRTNKHFVTAGSFVSITFRSSRERAVLIEMHGARMSDDGMIA